MVEVKAIDQGGLHTRVIHGPSGQAITTDAPKDNHGKGEAFSPTDLIAAALGSCLLTTMSLVARRHDLDLTGTRARVIKQMTTSGPRRIQSLEATVTFVKRFDETQRALLERAALACPVHQSLHPDVHAPVRFVYPT